MPTLAMSHFTVLTDDVPGTIRFYQDLLGLKDGARPPLGVPGAWLYIGEKPVLHVVGGRPRSDLKAGVIDHMAFDAEGLAPTITALEQRGVKYHCQRQAGAGTWQVFFTDPNGATVELDFASSEAPPPSYRQSSTVR